MAEFTASPIVSPYTNQLFNTASGATGMELQQNALNLQKTQQDIGVNDMSVVGRAAAGLLNMPEDQAAAAYGPLKQSLQAQGFGKNLPEQYPGHDVAQAFVQRALTVPEQYQYGLITAPGGTQDLQDIYGGRGKPGTAGGPAAPSTGAAAPGGGATAPTGGAGTNDNNFGNIRPVGAGGFNTYTTPQEGIAAMSSNLAAYARQHGINTLNGLTARWAPKGDGNNDPVAYAAALGKTLGLDPNAEINLADPLLQTRLIPAMAAVEKGRPFNQPAEVLTAGIQAGLSGKGGAAAPPAAPGGGVAARTGGTNVAGPGAGTTAPATAAAPSMVDMTGPRPLPPAGPGSPVATPASLANTPVMVPRNALAPGPLSPPTPTPTTTAAAPGAPGGPAPPSAQPAQPQQPALPHMADVPTGMNRPQVQQAQELENRATQIALRAARSPMDKVLQANAAAYVADLQQRAKNLMATDTVVQTQEGQLHTLTGAVDKPVGDYHETSPGSGIWVGGPGTEPRFQPPGRLIVTPGGDVYQTGSGGATLLKHTDPAAVAALKEAEASGTATGTAVAKQLPELMTQARNAAAQEGQIDYASNQLREAAKGGVPTGYFSQGLATAAAAAKSLGIDTSTLGINPEAVGNVQTAQKTLSVIGGAILRQAIGPGSAVTDAKVEQFIHTQPGIETDPQALQRIMAWARSQFTYERELGTAAVTEAAKPENAGRLPPHWLAAYYRDHGFAPIYDTGTQEMQQPDGRQPTRETPASEQVPTVKSASDYEGVKSGQQYKDPDGHIRRKP